MSLTSQIVAALDSFCTEMASAPRPFARERELVSWFVLGHLANQVRPASPLHHTLQIGIDLPCPQEIRIEKQRLFQDIFKVIAFWPHPADVCWTQQRRP